MSAAPPPPTFEWSDLRHLLAVARHGSTLAASRALGVNQSTVQRRLLELERCFGQPLVSRQSAGYRLTAYGEQLLPQAERVEQAALALQQQVEDARRDVSGVVRVTCPDPMVYRLTTSPLLERFHARFPGITVEFVMNDRYLDLRAGEADIALRAGEGPDDQLIAREIGVSHWAIYASRKYLLLHDPPAGVQEIGAHALVGFDESREDHRTAQWLREVAPQARYAARSGSVLGLLYSVRAGVGLAALPMTVGEGEPDLVRVLGPIEALQRNWYLMAARELRRAPRVATLFDFMIEDIATLRAVLL